MPAINLDRSNASVMLMLVSLIAGGAGAGYGLSWWLAPDSKVLLFLSVFYLPLIVFAGYSVYRLMLGLIVFRELTGGVAGIMRAWRARDTFDKSKYTVDEHTQDRIHQQCYRQAFVFTLVGWLAGLAGGSIAAFIVSDRFVLAFMSYLVAAVIYGILCSRALRAGYLLNRNSFDY